MSEIQSQDLSRLERITAEFIEALEALLQASTFAKANYQTAVYRLGTDLLDEPEGLAVLGGFAARFDDAGVFRGGPWENPSRLLPELVGLGLKGDGVIPTLECLSELRLLAIATEAQQSDSMTSEEAVNFLRVTCVKNLGLMFPDATEESRSRPRVFQRAERLFNYIIEHISIEGLSDSVIDEIETLCAQRPIKPSKTKKLINRAQKLIDNNDESKGVLSSRLEPFRRAIKWVTPAAREAGDRINYRQWLMEASDKQLEEEGLLFSLSMNQTGLVSPYHSVLLRRLLKADMDLLVLASGLNETGAAEAKSNAELFCQLIRTGILPNTAQAIYGLARTVERGLLSRSEVAGGLRKLIDLDILPSVRERLLSTIPKDSGLTVNAVLLAGSLSILGQALGIGQGNNSTCQAARAISLWSLHAPGQLLGMIANAARDGFVEAKFEGTDLKSDELLDITGTANIDLKVDPVSTVLVPHLDRIYNKMMIMVALRGEDGHKWVNPAMYGRWVPSGFDSAIDPFCNVKRHEDFLRRFYATHHPTFNEGHELIYPNPVGIIVTDVHGNTLGPHAVSIQRIAESPKGDLRIYFFNPNNEGRQDWGQGVAPTVCGHGEKHGESSLPFEHFLSRMYAFHYDPYEEGDGYAVPKELIDKVSGMAKDSWGRTYTWLD
jgi:hypothetical protein